MGHWRGNCVGADASDQSECASVRRCSAHRSKQGGSHLDRDDASAKVKLRDSKQGTPYQFRDHALFVAFAPYDKPEIAVAVVVEHGEHGGGSAATIAGRMLRAYFDGKKPLQKSTGSQRTTAAEDEEAENPPPTKAPRPNGDPSND